MIKKSFVWFLMLCLPMLASIVSRSGSVVATQGSVQSCERQETFTSVADLVFHEICEESEGEALPIVRADEYEWRENLSDLLRHRVSSYRFVFFECGISSYFHFPQKQVVIKCTATLNRIARKILTLPDYYCFLHRLCPF